MSEIHSRLLKDEYVRISIQGGVGGVEEKQEENIIITNVTNNYSK